MHMTFSFADFLGFWLPSSSLNSFLSPYCLITSLKKSSPLFKQFQEQDLDSLLIIPKGPI